MCIQWLSCSSNEKTTGTLKKGSQRQYLSCIQLISVCCCCCCCWWHFIFINWFLMPESFYCCVFVHFIHMFTRDFHSEQETTLRGWERERRRSNRNVYSVSKCTYSWSGWIYSKQFCLFIVSKRIEFESIHSHLRLVKCKRSPEPYCSLFFSCRQCERAILCAQIFQSLSPFK